MASHERDTKPAQQTGVPCPECHAVIAVTIGELLRADPIACPRCGLRLTIDEQRSHAALDILHQLAEAMRQLERVRKQRL